MEYTSGSELSCDTVVYVNKSGIAMSDRELTDNESPPDLHFYRQTRNQSPVGQPPKEYLPKEDGMVYNIAQAKVIKSIGFQSERENFAYCGNTLKLLKSKSSFHQEYPSTNITPKDLFPEKIIPSKNASTNEVMLSKTLTNFQLIQTNNVDRTKGIHNSSKKLVQDHKNSFIPILSKSNVNEASTNLQNIVVEPTSDTHSQVQNLRKVLPRCRENSKLKPVKPPRNSINTLEQTKKKSPSRQSSLPRPRKNISSCSSSKMERQSYLGDQIKKNIPINNVQITDKQLISNNLKPNQSLQQKDLQYENSTSNKISFSGTSHSKDDSITFTIRHDSFDQHDQTTSSFEHYSKTQDKRPDPVGCEFDFNVSSTSAANQNVSMFTQSRSMSASDSNNEKDVRPESMIVNIDDNDWLLLDNQEESEAIDVNFYCLTFTTQNPLIPMSKQKFNQQIKTNMKRKSLSEIANIIDPETLTNDVQCGDNNFHNDQLHNNLQQQMFEAENSQLSSENMNERNLSLPACNTMFADQSISEACKNKKQACNCNNVDQNAYGIDFVHDSRKLSEKELEMSEIKEIPKLPYSYSTNTYSGKNKLSVNENVSDMQSKNTGSVRSSFYNSPNREVCLYDSNSLAISYVDTKQPVQSAPETLFRADTSLSLGKKDEMRKNEIIKRNICPVVMTKSTSEEGATLTLIKKQRSGGHTLELLITNKNNKDVPIDASNEQSIQTLAGKCQHVKATKTSLNKHSIAKSADESPRKLKWPGLKRFGSKKKPEETKPLKQKLQKTKSSLVSKILTSKSKPSSSKEGAQYQKLKHSSFSKTHQSKKNTVERNTNSCCTQSRPNLKYENFCLL